MHDTSNIQLQNKHEIRAEEIGTHSVPDVNRFILDKSHFQFVQELSTIEN